MSENNTSPTKEKREKTYYFSVEGQTEKLYLEWLEGLINEKTKDLEVHFNIIVSRSPSKRINSMPQKEENIVYHFCDFEADDPYHIKQFKQVIDHLVSAKKRKHISDYILGYCNQTFDLWIILHKTDSFAPNVDRKKYIQQINKAFGKKYRGMQEFKKEDNLKRLFKQFTLEDVKAAIGREKQIMKRNQDIGHPLLEYKGYTYYKDNPSLTVGEIIETILKECELL